MRSNELLTALFNSLNADPILRRSGRLVVEETTRGCVDGKIAEYRNKCKSTWWRMRDKKV